MSSDGTWSSLVSHRISFLSIQRIPTCGGDWGGFVDRERDNNKRDNWDWWTLDCLTVPLDEFNLRLLSPNRQNAHVARELFVDESRLLRLSTYSPARYTKILFHGFTNDVVSEFVIQTRNGTQSSYRSFKSFTIFSPLVLTASRLHKVPHLSYFVLHSQTYGGFIFLFCLMCFPYSLSFCRRL